MIDVLSARAFDWGLRPYREVHALQERLVDLRAAGEIGNVLLVGEHPPVVTLGRKTPKDFPPVDGVEVVEIERGGEATYHGPGQVVLYPIVHLTEARRDLHRYQRDLEEVGIRVCRDLGVDAVRVRGKTGVWTGGKKVMSIGVAVRRWVTWHGLALNVSTDLSAFRLFSPCGLDGSLMTSLAERLGRDPGVAAVKARVLAHASSLLPGGPFVSTVPGDFFTSVKKSPGTVLN